MARYLLVQAIRKKKKGKVKAFVPPLLFFNAAKEGETITLRYTRHGQQSPFQQQIVRRWHDKHNCTMA